MLLLKLYLLIITVCSSFTELKNRSDERAVLKKLQVSIDDTHPAYILLRFNGRKRGVFFRLNEDEGQLFKLDWNTFNVKNDRQILDRSDRAFNKIILLCKRAHCYVKMDSLYENAGCYSL